MADWVVLELGPMAEGEDPSTIRASIRHLIRDAEVFVPASVTQVGEDRVINYLLDGYAFVRRDHPDSVYFRLEDTRYVQTVVRDYSARGRRLACVTDRDIDKFRRQIRAQSDQGIAVGDTVVINSGPYRNLQAVVIEDIPEQDSVQVSVELRSKDSLITLPRSFLHLSSKATLPSYVLQVREARAWFDTVRPALRWDPQSFGPIHQRYAEWKRLDHWLSNGRATQAAVRFESSSQSIDALYALQGRHATFARWLDQGVALQGFFRAFHQPLDLTPIVRAFARCERLVDWCVRSAILQQALETVYRPLPLQSLAETAREHERLHKALLLFLDIERAVRSIEHRMMGNTVVENIVIDGMNLAVRCSMAPGLSELRDSKGRPTGAITGFLNSLSALRKKHPHADIWVCWDSPSVRRKMLYAEYKANRNPLRVTFEVEWLKANLSALGVWQARAEGEEADDVIASLVRGRLDGQTNLIVSNDRDFMQLVTDTTHVLVPAVGAGKERLCTPDAVLQEYGVPPEKMVHLRAFGGDTSDNLPGAPGCGTKTACKLLSLYGTVEGVFASSLAGHPPALRDKIRSAEAQVRLNLRLMSLVTDLPLDLATPCADKETVSVALDEIGMNQSRVISAFFAYPSLGRLTCRLPVTSFRWTPCRSQTASSLRLLMLKWRRRET